jgi:ribonuclease P protein component
MGKSNSLSRAYSLKSQKEIAVLLRNGKSILKYPLRCVYLEESNGKDSGKGLAVAFSVPKKRIKLAVQRNKVKRRIREAFRLNKGSILLDKDTGKKRSILFIYVAEEVLDYRIIEKSMKKLMTHWETNE